MSNKLLYITIIVITSIFSLNLFAHSVQVVYCISCSGQLRLYVEHWHGSQNPSSTTMTLDVTVNGTTTQQTGSPVANLQNVPFAQLPNCATPPSIISSCPSYANTYNDWVVYDFPGIPAGSNVSIKVISGNNVFTEDACSMFPASSPTFVVTPINQPPITVPPANVCGGTASSGITFPPGNPPGGTYIWTNDNPSIGIPASGSGNIPPFTPPPSSTTQVANITVSYMCATTTFTVTVLPSSGPDFNYLNIVHNGQNGSDPSVQCLGDSTGFQAQTTPGVNIQSFLWDFGDGTSSTLANPVHLFQNSGNYNVSLQVTTADGCTQTSTSTITINPKPVASFTSNPVCEYDAVNFTNTSTINYGSIANNIWNFGDGTLDNNTNPSHLYQSDGNYQVGLLVTSLAGCKDSTTRNQIIHPKPFATFTNTTECENDATFFTDNSTASVNITNWEWDFENDGNVNSNLQNPSNIYSYFGTYTSKLTITDANGCIDDTLNNITVNPLPVAMFNSDTVCPTFNTSFIDLSSVSGGGSISNWEWDFGNDGIINSNSQNTTNVWNQGGVYNVELKVETSDGCKDSILKTVNIYPKPVASFSNNTVCLGTNTNFIDNSTVTLSNTVSSWEWNFDDGNSSSVQNSSNLYNSNGFYNVTLMVETNNGCRDTATNSVEVYAMPEVNFSMPNKCEYDSVNFTNSTTILSQDNITYVWNFGDNTTSTLENPKHIYNIEGTYSVNLRAISSNNCIEDSTINVEIYDEPNALFSVSNDCVYETFNFTDYSNTTSNISQWDWNFNDGNTSNNQSPTHIFATEGVYEVKLVVTTTDLCTDTSIIQLEVYPKPVANFTPTSVCLNTPTEFQDLSQVSNQVFNGEHVLQNSSWDFGDGSTSYGNSIQHTYNSPGVYDATIIVKTNNNCKDTAQMQVTVHNNPIASFVTADSLGCSPVEARFINTSTISNIPSNYSLTYKWYFDNGQTDTNSHTSSVFTNTSNTDIQTFGASLVATSNYGCKDSVYNSDVVIVNPIPFPDFVFEPEETNVYNTLVEFSDQSIGASFWDWKLGDGSYFSEQNPIHTYADSGTYVIDLRIENGYGCTDSISKELRINPVFEVFIPNSITPNGDGINDEFMVDGYGISEQEMLIFDRWGKLLYEGHKVGDKWNGFVNGNANETSVYVYVVKIVDLHNNKHDYKGSITVIR